MDNLRELYSINDTTLELIDNALSEFFNSNIKLTFTKDEIMKYLKEKLIFCDFNPINSEGKIDDKYIWMILKNYTLKRQLELVQDGQILVIKNDRH